MPNIVSIANFKKANELNIPLAVAVPNSNPSTATPSNEAYLTNLIIKEEKAILLSALGLATYNTLQLALADINNPLYASYKKLVQGDAYDGKVWNGLSGDYSLLNYRIYEVFVTETNTRLSAIGTTKVNPQGAEQVTPIYKIANANQNFLKQYQGSYLFEPIIYENFIDWQGQNDDVEVSMYKYLLDKQSDFLDFKIENFKVFCESKNSFGI
jgi:hypothetical protein